MCEIFIQNQRAAQRSQSLLDRKPLNIDTFLIIVNSFSVGIFFRSNLSFLILNNVLLLISYHNLTTQLAHSLYFFSSIFFKFFNDHTFQCLFVFFYSTFLFKFSFDSIFVELDETNEFLNANKCIFEFFLISFARLL